MAFRRWSLSKGGKKGRSIIGRGNMGGIIQAHRHRQRSEVEERSMGEGGVTFWLKKSEEEQDDRRGGLTKKSQAVETPVRKPDEEMSKFTEISHRLQEETADGPHGDRTMTQKTTNQTTGRKRVHENPSLERGSAEKKSHQMLAPKAKKKVSPAQKDDNAFVYEGISRWA